MTVAGAKWGHFCVARDAAELMRWFPVSCTDSDTDSDGYNDADADYYMEYDGYDDDDYYGYSMCACWCHGYCETHHVNNCAECRCDNCN
jgi:hypothetical protein